MDLSNVEILTALSATLGAVMTVSYQVEKKGGIGGLTCLLLSFAALIAWLIVFYSIYLLVGNTLEYFGQPKAPYLIRLFWPEDLLPYAPLLLSVFAWWHTNLILPYWVRRGDETEEELADRLRWHMERIRRSLLAWFIGYLIILLAVQAVYRCPRFSWVFTLKPL